MEELSVVKKEKDSEKCFIIDNLRTICPHTNKEDFTRLKITYVPGKVDVSEEELRDHIEEHIEGQELVMEIIPLRILNYFIERTTQTPSRHAAPSRIQIISHSKGKAKKWEMIVNIEFRREIR